MYLNVFETLISEKSYLVHMSNCIILECLPNANVMDNMSDLLQHWDNEFPR